MVLLLSEPRAEYAVRSGRWYITVIHSIPIESWVVEDENHFGARPSTARIFRSDSKLGPLRNRRSAVRIVTGGKPRIHQLEQERRRSSGSFL